jgi:hypothetical protein
LASDEKKYGKKAENHEQNLKLAEDDADEQAQIVYYIQMEKERQAESKKYMEEEPHVLESQKFEIVEWIDDLSYPDDKVT